MDDIIKKPAALPTAIPTSFPTRFLSRLAEKPALEAKEEIEFRNK